MNLQISPIGVLLLAAVYAAVFAALALITPPGRRKWKAVAVVAALPVLVALGEELWIARSFRGVCKDAGVRVTRKVVVDGLLEDISRPSSSSVTTGLIDQPATIKEFDEVGYRYMERLLSDGRVSHLERIPSGLQRTLIDRPIARYHYVRRQDDADAGYAISCTEDVVVDSQEKETIATSWHCKRYAALFERAWRNLISRGPIEYCPALDRRVTLLYREVLIPANKR